MSNEQKKVPIDHIQRTVQQAELVERLATEYKEVPSDELTQRLEIEMEALAFFQTTAKGNPRARARHVIERARSVVLGRAVTQPLPKLT